MTKKSCFLILLFWVSAFTIAIPRSHAQLLFGPSRVDLDLNAVAYTVADMNGDGLADIIAVSDAGKMTLYTGQIFGGYTSEEFYDGPWSLSSRYAWFFTPDCNNDGHIDVIFAESGDQTLNVFFGDGAGHFSDPVSTPITEYGFSEDSFPACTGDVNGDGFTDLVYQDMLFRGTFPDYYLCDYVLLGNGNGFFTVSDTLISKTLSLTFELSVIQDFNEDGNNEIAVVRNSTGLDIDSLYVYSGDGTGKFSLNSVWGIGMEVQNLIAGDFNNDGHMDVMSGSSSFESGYWEPINVRLGDGSGGFPIQRSTALGEKLWKARAADFDGDGVLDVAFLSMDRGLGTMFGNGDGTFSQITYHNQSLWISLYSIDINGDTFEDLVFHTYGGLSFLFNNGTGDFEVAPQFPDGLQTCDEPVKSSAIAVDVDRNDTADLVLSNPCSDALSLLHGNGDGTFGPAIEKIDLPVRLTTAITADLNSDGRPDIVGGNITDRSVTTILAKETGGFDEPHRYDVSTGPGKMVEGDFNRDGKIDIAFLSRDKFKIVTLFGDGSGSFSASSELIFTDSLATFCTADFDRDGRLDLAAYYFFSPTFQPLSIYSGDGAGGFARKGDFAGLIAATALMPADVNNDTHTDIVVTGMIGAVVHLGDGTGNFTLVEQEENLMISGKTTDALLLDVNADSYIDLLVSDFNNFTEHVKVFLGTGDGQFLSSFFNYGVSGPAGTLCPADFDGDGSVDIAVVHPDSGIVSVLSSPIRLEHDIAVTSITAPGESATAGVAITPRAVVVNRGVSAENFQLECKIGDTYRHLVDVVLNSGEQKTVGFPQWVPEDAGVYNVEMTSFLAADQIPGNDKKTISVTVTEPGGEKILVIDGVTPNRGGDNGWLTVTISGDHFADDTEVKLINNGREIPASGYFTEQTAVISSTKMTAVFDLNGAELGSWDVVVENSDGSSFTFKNGLTVEPGEKTLWVDIIGPTRFDLSAHYETFLTYESMIGNSGNINLDNAVLVLDIPRWLELWSIVKSGTNDTLLLGDSNRIYNIIDGEKRDSLQVVDIDSTKIPFWAGILNPNEVQSFQVNVRGNWSKYRDLVIRPRLKKTDRTIQDDDGTGIGISGFLMSGAKCFGKNLAESFADKGDLTLQDFEDAGEKTLQSMGEDLFWSGVTLAVEIIFPWTIPIIEGYNIASGLIGSIESAGQMLRLAFKFLLLFAQWWGDPNFKEGPAGYGAEGYITDNRPYTYQIHFENDSAATASPPFVIVRDTLDGNLDWSTFQNIDSSHPLTSTILDSMTGEVTWLFDGIQLPPNKNPPEGEAWLSYRIWPKTGLASGTRISNRASIVFAAQDTIVTNTVINTIDNKPPTARVKSLPATQNHVAFTVDWSGEDSESGIYLYNIYVAKNNGDFELWKQSKNTSDVFIGKNGDTYYFYCTAIDHVGHISSQPFSPDAMTTIEAEEDIGVDPNPFVPSRGHEKITFFGGAIKNAEIKIFNKAGRLVATLQETEGRSTLIWDGTNDGGENLASGVYIWVLTKNRDSKSRGKFAIIR